MEHVWLTQPAPTPTHTPAWHAARSAGEGSQHRQGKPPPARPRFPSALSALLQLAAISVGGIAGALFAQQLLKDCAIPPLNMYYSVEATTVVGPATNATTAGSTSATTTTAASSRTTRVMREEDVRLAVEEAALERREMKMKGRLAAPSAWGAHPGAQPRGAQWAL